MKANDNSPQAVNDNRFETTCRSWLGGALEFTRCGEWATLGLFTFQIYNRIGRDYWIWPGIQFSTQKGN